MQNDDDLGSRKDSAESTATTATSRAPSERQDEVVAEKTEPPKTGPTRRGTEDTTEATTKKPKDAKEKKNSKEKDSNGKDKRSRTESSSCDRRLSAPAIPHYGNYPPILCVPCPCFNMSHQNCASAYAMYHPIQPEHLSHHYPQQFHDCNRCHSGYYRQEPTNFYDQGYANRWPSSHCQCDPNGGQWSGHGQIWSAAEGCCPPASSDFRLFAPRPPAKRCRREYYLQIPKGRCRTEEEDLETAPEETVTEPPSLVTTTTMPPRPTNFPINFRLQKSTMASPIGNKKTDSQTDKQETKETSEKQSYMVSTNIEPEDHQAEHRRSSVNERHSSADKRQSSVDERQTVEEREIVDERQSAEERQNPMEQPIQETAASVLRKRHNEIKRQEIQEMLENDIEKTNLA